MRATVGLPCPGATRAAFDGVPVAPSTLSPDPYSVPPVKVVSVPRIRMPPSAWTRPLTDVGRRRCGCRLMRSGRPERRGSGQGGDGPGLGLSRGRVRGAEGEHGVRVMDSGTGTKSLSRLPERRRSTPSARGPPDQMLHEHPIHPAVASGGRLRSELAVVPRSCQSRAVFQAERAAQPSQVSSDPPSAFSGQLRSTLHLILPLTRWGPGRMVGNCRKPSSWSLDSGTSSRGRWTRCQSR
jgi:hypothetical protein